MPKFTFAAEMTITVFTMVEAASEEAARTLLEERDLTRIKDEGDAAKVWRTSGELDGTPVNVRLEE
jgi:muconolactone delta-isomerase